RPRPPSAVAMVDWDGTVVVTTPRLLLRTFRRDDLPVYAALNADPEVVRYLGGVPFSREYSDGIAEWAQERYAAEGLGLLAVQRPGAGRDAAVGEGVRPRSRRGRRRRGLPRGRLLDHEWPVARTPTRSVRDAEDGGATDPDAFRPRRTGGVAGSVRRSRRGR